VEQPLAVGFTDACFSHKVKGGSNGWTRRLRALFAKTGTTRQAELVKLVARFANPVA
jgi:hypothetical protein